MPVFIHARWVRRRARWSATAKPPPRRRSASPAATTTKSWAMAEFAYLAIAPSGTEQRGHIAAETIAAARAVPDRRRLFVMRIGSEPRRAAAPALLRLESQKPSAKHRTLLPRMRSHDRTTGR